MANQGTAATSFISSMKPLSFADEEKLADGFKAILAPAVTITGTRPLRPGRKAKIKPVAIANPQKIIQRTGQMKARKLHPRCLGFSLCFHRKQVF